MLMYQLLTVLQSPIVRSRADMQLLHCSGFANSVGCCIQAKYDVKMTQ